MAENAAHITSSLQAKPSIFEVIAQESLSELLYPSFKIIVQFLGSVNPQKYHWLNEWYEEVFLGINSLLQLHYLNSKDASFSESFYGLKRVSSNNNKLSIEAKYWSLFCLVGLPYLAHKAEQYSIKLQNLKMGDILGLGHRTVLVSWRTACLIQYLLYLTGHAGAHSLLLSVANLSLKYCPEQSYSPFSWTECISSPGACMRILSNSLTQSLELAAFFLQCLQWWHSEDHSHVKIVNHIPSAPPEVLNTQRMSQAVCPLCKNICQIETALLTSGYVFCYRCIRESVIDNQKCPVTGLPTTLDELIRLYPTK